MRLFLLQVEQAKGPGSAPSCTKAAPQPLSLLDTASVTQSVMSSWVQRVMGSGGPVPVTAALLAYCMRERGEFLASEALGQLSAIMSGPETPEGLAGGG